MYLKKMKVPNVWVKAVNGDYATLLRKIGAGAVIIPEHIAAAQLADRIHIHGIIDRLPRRSFRLAAGAAQSHWLDAPSGRPLAGRPRPAAGADT